MYSLQSVFSFRECGCQNLDVYLWHRRRYMTESQLLGLAAEIIGYVKPSHNMGKTLRSIDSELHLQE